MTDPLVLLGRVVTFDPAQPVIDEGALYIGADELIAAVQDASDCSAEWVRKCSPGVRPAGRSTPG